MTFFHHYEHTNAKILLLTQSLHRLAALSRPTYTILYAGTLSREGAEPIFRINASAYRLSEREKSLWFSNLRKFALLNHVLA